MIKFKHTYINRTSSKSSNRDHSRASKVLKTRDVPRDRVTHLLQAFPSPANGIHLPADLPLLLVGQNGVERPRIRTAVPGTGDLWAKKAKKQNSSKKWQELPPSFLNRAGSSPQQLWRHHTTGWRAVAREGGADTQIKGHSSSFRRTWLWLCCGAGPYLGSEQHVVHQLHVRLHLRPLNVVQAVAQRVTLKNKKQKGNVTRIYLPVLDWIRAFPEKLQKSGTAHVWVLGL